MAIHSIWVSEIGIWHGNYFFFIVRRLSGAPFVVSAVFLPQRVQFLADSGGDSWFFADAM